MNHISISKVSLCGLGLVALYSVYVLTTRYLEMKNNIEKKRLIYLKRKIDLHLYSLPKYHFNDWIDINRVAIQMYHHTAQELEEFIDRILKSDTDEDDKVYQLQIVNSVLYDKLFRGKK